MHVRMFGYMYVCMYVCVMYACMFVCMYVCVGVCLVGTLFPNARVCLRRDGNSDARDGA